MKTLTKHDPLPASKEDLLFMIREGFTIPIECSTADQKKEIITWLHDVGGFSLSEYAEDCLKHYAWLADQYHAPGVGHECYGYDESVVTAWLDSRGCPVTYDVWASLPDTQEPLRADPNDLADLLF